MNKQPTPLDFSTAAPELQRLAKEVQASKQPRSIQKDGETIAVVNPPGEEVSTMEKLRAALFTPPSPEELARRQALVKQILAERTTRVITPLTSASRSRSSSRPRNCSSGSAKRAANCGVRTDASRSQTS